MVVPQHGTKPAAKRFIYVIGLLIAGALGYGAFSLFQDHESIASTGILVEGRMTGRLREVQTTGRGRTTTYHPIVTFRTAEGRIVVGPTASSTDREAVVPGRAVGLQYDPADPSIVYLADAVGAGPGVLPWILGGLSGLVALLSLWGLVAGRPLRLPF